MIPAFPTFKKLSLEDMSAIDLITNNYAPYSDFNFVSLWSYNTENDVLISLLHGNLVIKFRDYITNEPFYTFIGKNKVSETITALLTIAKKEHILLQLKLIPEENLINNSEVNKSFIVKEDRDNFDYIYFSEKLAKLEGQEYGKKRGWVNHFKRNYPDAKIEFLDLTNENIISKIFKTFSIWQDHKNKTDEEVNHELTAIKLLLSKVKQLNLISLGVFVSHDLAAFAIIEIFHKNYALYHFIKADVTYKGIYQFLYQSLAQILYKNGCTYINREQDLGIPELRSAKESWHPNLFLKKYIISEKIIS